MSSENNSCIVNRIYMYTKEPLLGNKLFILSFCIDFSLFVQILSSIKTILVSIPKVNEDFFLLTLFFSWAHFEFVVFPDFCFPMLLTSKQFLHISSMKLSEIPVSSYKYLKILQYQWERTPEPPRFFTRQSCFIFLSPR